MRVKLSATFEGKCQLCNKKKIVFTAGDEDSKRIITICKKCADNLGDMQVSEVIEKYGKKDEKAFEEGIKFEKKPIAG